MFFMSAYTRSMSGTIKFIFAPRNRVVKSEKLVGRIPNLTRRLRGEDDNDFIYAAYVDGSLLDESVNDARTDFSIAEADTELAPGSDHLALDSLCGP